MGIDYNTSRLATPIAGTPEGDRVRAQFLASLFHVLTDTELLYLANLTDGTTSTEDSRFGVTITWSESQQAFDVTPVRVGSGAAAVFNGTDEEGDTPDLARFSFGDGANDSPFSLIALIKPDTISGIDTLIAKWDETSATELREWEFILNAGVVEFHLFDESANAQVGRTAPALTAGTWTLLIVTTAGDGLATGINIFKDGVAVDDTDDDSGVYVAMEDLATVVTIASQIGSGGSASNFFDGSIGYLAIVNGAISVDEAFTLNKEFNSYFGLSL